MNMAVDDPTLRPGHEGGFADQVRGTEPRREDIEFPALIQDLYNVADERRAGRPLPAEPELPGGWHRMDAWSLRAAGIDPELMRGDKNGFDGGLYRNDEGQVVLVMAGTNELQDWKHNLRQGLGMTSDQYAQGLELARQAKTAFGDDLVLTGQSLGGGLAATAAMVTDTPAVTYNAAGVHNHTLEREGLDAKAAKEYADNGLVRHYVVKNDFLTHLQEDAFIMRSLMPDAPGHKIELPDPDPLSFGERLIPGRMAYHRIEVHFIESVMEAQRQAGLYDQFPEKAQAPAQAATPSDQFLRDMGISDAQVADWNTKVDQQRQTLEQSSQQANLEAAAAR